MSVEARPRRPSAPTAWPPITSKSLAGSEQQWKMFAPSPATEHGWPILVARLADGSERDLLRDGAPIDWSRPRRVTAIYRDSVWGGLLREIRSKHYAYARPYVAGYLCRRWNNKHPPEHR